MIQMSAKFWASSTTRSRYTNLKDSQAWETLPIPTLKWELMRISLLKLRLRPYVICAKSFEETERGRTKWKIIAVSLARIRTGVFRITWALSIIAETQQSTNTQIREIEVAMRSALHIRIANITSPITKTLRIAISKVLTSHFIRNWILL